MYYGGRVSSVADTERRRTITLVPPAPRGPRVGGGVLARYFLPGLVIVLAVFIFLIWPLLVQVQINIWWFDSLTIGSVYQRVWDTQRLLFFLFGLLSYVFLTLLFFVTRRLLYKSGLNDNAQALDRLITLVVGALAAVVSMIAGSTMASSWQDYLLASHAQSFGILDPIHHRDIGFYIFTMPWREELSGFVISLLGLGALEVVALAVWYTFSSPFQTLPGDIRRMVSIASLFAGVLFLYLAWRNFFLNPYYLNQPGTVYGGGATFVHATLWWYTVTGLVEIVTAVVLLANTAVRRLQLLPVAALPIIAAIAAGGGQSIFQRFVVSPNELNAEFQYLGYTLHYTRQAYGMDQWRVREYTPRALTSADVSADRATVNDARIADLGAFTQVMRQRQENRTYYAFNNANIDRYSIHGAVRQVLLAPRELAFWQLSQQAQTWVNEHIKFTHGFGLTMAPANHLTPDGQPALWIQNVPVQETISGLPPVVQPRIYFGEFTNSWILVHTTTPEYDTATRDQDTSYTYQGPDGISLGSGTKRLSLAWNVEGGNPFIDRLNISNYIKPDSRILLHRNIFDRVSTIAPWLLIDPDPYLVLRKNGTLVWMMDGITRSDRYPYSDPTDGDNYRRNSVKIVVDAYTGRTTLYAFDSHDPILKAWSAIFPGLIHPFSQMPADLKAHIKYADSYLTWQANAYQRYHVTDVTSYYNGDNQWDIASTSAYNWNDGATETNPMDPFWTVARLFGEKHDSFFSILPFSVHGKNTMAGYVAADNITYGVTALDMPRGAQTMGATQFESLYQQAPSISSALTLLDQHGSQVVPGLTLALPVGKALLYVKPLYLRSQSNQSLPQLIKVVVGTQNAVNWGSTLPSALNNLLTQGDISTLSQAPTTTSPPQATPSAPPPTATGSARYGGMNDAQLIALASSYYQAAQQTPSLTEKDRDLRQVGIILQVLRGRHR